MLKRTLLPIAFALLLCSASPVPVLPPVEQLRSAVRTIAVVATNKLVITRHMTKDEALLVVSGISSGLWALSTTNGAGDFDSTRQAVLYAFGGNDFLAEQIGDALAVAVEGAVLRGLSEETANDIAAGAIMEATIK